MGFMVSPLNSLSGVYLLQLYYNLVVIILAASDQFWQHSENMMSINVPKCPY